VLVLHGPNLNLLGTREPRVYGREALSAINRRLMAAGRTAGTEVLCYQSNVEGELIERIQQAARNRHRSYFSDLAVGTICGLGSRGYDFALDFALKATALKAAARR